jgi:hypothetical protein
MQYSINLGIQLHLKKSSKILGKVNGSIEKVKHFV